MLVIQVVEIFWTKATRGAPRSNERVLLRREFPFVLPVSADPSACFIQRHQMAEWDHFAPKLVSQEEHAHGRRSVDALQVTPLGSDSYSLGLLGTPHDGQPRRHPVFKAITLQAGETARMTLNARHTSYSGQHYSESIYNVGCGTDLLADLFLHAPVHLLDLKAHLF